MTAPGAVVASLGRRYSPARPRADDVGRGSRLWWGYLSICLVLTAGAFVLTAGFSRGVLLTGLGLGAVLAGVWGVRSHRPDRADAWLCLAAGSGMWLIGSNHALRAGLPWEHLADVVFVLGYPSVALALWNLGRDRVTPRGDRAPRDRAATFDALIVGVVFTLTIWVLMIVPWWEAPGMPPLERAVAGGHLVGMLLLVAWLAHFSASRVERTTSVRLLALAAWILIASDVVVHLVPGSGSPGQYSAILDALRVAGYVVWAGAALHPSMALPPARTVPADAPVAKGRVVLLGAAVLVVPLFVLVEIVSGRDPHILEVAIAAVAMVVLIIGRMLVMVHQMNYQTERLVHLADTDFLTGLESARRFTARVREWTDADADADAGDGGPTEPPVAVLLVAVDRFTEINDTLGLRTGEDLLRAAGQRLAGSVSDDGVVARLGGDAFGILLSGQASSEAVMSRAAELRATFTAPFLLPDVTVAMDVCVGVAFLQGPVGRGTDLLHRADLALSAARESPEGVARYAGEMEMGGALTPQLMGELHGAMAKNQIVMHFQPQVELSTGRVVGVEALVRWRHPQHGLLGPAAFVPAAERTGLIRPLTMHVLDRALSQAASWREAGPDLTVAVNMSVRNLLDPDFVTDVRAALDRYSLPPSSIELEITETMAMLDPHRSLEVLGALNRLGIALSVDDYGTGYSSLAYLQRLPVQRLKIDRSFVAGVLTDSASAVIVRSTIEMARHLGLSVVAEGVEDDETYLALFDMQCWAAQGFGLGRPVEGHLIPDLVDQVEGRLHDLVRQRRPGPPTAATSPRGRLPTRAWVG